MDARVEVDAVGDTMSVSQVLRAPSRVSRCPSAWPGELWNKTRFLFLGLGADPCSSLKSSTKSWGLEFKANLVTLLLCDFG